MCKEFFDCLKEHNIAYKEENGDIIIDDNLSLSYSNIKTLPDNLVVGCSIFGNDIIPKKEIRKKEIQDKHFVESLDKTPRKLTPAVVIKLTEGQYGHEKYKEFFMED